MRPVVTIEHASGPSAAAALLKTVTILNAAGQTRVVATYAGSTSLGGVDPSASTVGPTSDVPSAAVILATQPLRLSETPYNLRGLVQEQREYDPATGGYTVATTYYDHSDHAVRVILPGGREEWTTFDAVGRAVAHSTYAAGAEQARVESDYDVSNVIAVRSLERVATAGTTLSASNSVTRFTYKWHDSKNRVVASADLGAGADPATNPYATATPPSRGAAPIPIIGTDGRITQINRQGLPSWVRITCTAYNDQGQEAVVVAPNLSVTRKSYNGYGELVSTVENADSANPSDASRRITAYKYDSGRLVKIAAILDDVADPNWETYQGKVQITQLLYGDPANNDPGAEVVDSGGNSFTPPNFNGAWISQVRFPDPVTGLPSPTDTLTFKYFITGQIARRTDARGVVIRYTYDELGRCIRQTIDTSALAMPPGGSPLDVVRRVDFS